MSSANDSFRRKMLRLSEENRALHEDLTREEEPQPQPLRAAAPPADSGGGDLAAENAELRQLVEELNAELAQTEELRELVQQFQRREQEYESLLEEKSEVIRQLHGQVQEAKLKAPEAPPMPTRPMPANQDEVAELYEEFERESAQFARERAEFDRERTELKRDEEALRVQMREMEIQMSKERAELARHRNDLQRLQSELQRQLEAAARDQGIKERLAPLYRLQEEMASRRASAETPRPRPSLPVRPPPAPAAETKGEVPDTRPVRRSGFFKRLFGRDQQG